MFNFSQYFFINFDEKNIDLKKKNLNFFRQTNLIFSVKKPTLFDALIIILRKILDFRLIEKKLTRKNMNFIKLDFLVKSLKIFFLKNVR